MDDELDEEGHTATSDEAVALSAKKKSVSLLVTPKEVLVLARGTHHHFEDEPTREPSNESKIETNIWPRSRVLTSPTVPNVTGEFATCVGPLKRYR